LTVWPPAHLTVVAACLPEQANGHLATCFLTRSSKMGLRHTVLPPALRHTVLPQKLLWKEGGRKRATQHHGAQSDLLGNTHISGASKLPASLLPKLHLSVYCRWLETQRQCPACRAAVAYQPAGRGPQFYKDCPAPNMANTPHHITINQAPATAASSVVETATPHSQYVDINFLGASD
jgi:hypothetical protein